MTTKGKLRTARVLARCTECGGEAKATGKGHAAGIKHKSDCVEGFKYETRVVLAGVAKGSSVVYTPRREDDGFPWVVISSRWNEFKDWRFKTSEVGSK